MLCDDPHRLADAYVDNELWLEDRDAFESHMQTCESCTQRVERLKALSRAFSKVGREPMPDSLGIYFNHRFSKPAPARVDTVTNVVPLPAPVKSRPPGRITRAGLRWATAIAVTAVLSSSTAVWLTEAHLRRDQAADELVSAHLRSLVQNSPVQVASSDEHNVKPWFNGKVDFAPEVRDLSAEGFPLVGGRLDIINGKRVGVLVYRHRLHLIDIFAVSSEATGEPAPLDLARSGYNILRWTRNGIIYCAVSDLSRQELLQLAGLL